MSMSRYVRDVAWWIVVGAVVAILAVSVIRASVSYSVRSENHELLLRVACEQASNYARAKAALDGKQVSLRDSIDTFFDCYETGKPPSLKRPESVQKPKTGNHPTPAVR